MIPLVCVEFEFPNSYHTLEALGSTSWIQAFVAIYLTRMKLSADEYDDVKRGSYGGDVIQLEQQAVYDEHMCTK